MGKTALTTDGSPYSGQGIAIVHAKQGCHIAITNQEAMHRHAKEEDLQ